MDLDTSNKEFINLLKTAGLPPENAAFFPVSGGDINDSYRAETGIGTYFVKTNSGISDRFFSSEAEGLAFLAKEGGANVPNVIGTAYAGGRGVLVLEWIEGGKVGRTGEKLGEMLARVHSNTKHKKFGYPHATYIGTLEQQNGLWLSWTDYYREQRLIPQLNIGTHSGIITAERQKKIEQLTARLDQWLPQRPEVSILHGDLWSGNWMNGSDGSPWLVDPSVLYGHREMDLAFTELFGGFPGGFYEAYGHHLPLDADYGERKPLYQLFYLLVHLNFFGEQYGKPVDRILDYYISAKD
ncbi:fructosamine kinase [Alteribacter lacisalsi]|uniref:Fructosamine kinase n=1 Tax=Alteribacter lacisalsi TaxID=2045244 RepID=A0A2W0H920_9BACI|nr:fructosamine kinase family protein [Alteribacter lacisalsi]PYZ98334.1 fructosamine kinase [Alteribacter lacisalsi]